MSLTLCQAGSFSHARCCWRTERWAFDIVKAWRGGGTKSGERTFLSPLYVGSTYSEMNKGFVVVVLILKKIIVIPVYQMKLMVISQNS